MIVVFESASCFTGRKIVQPSPYVDTFEATIRSVKLLAALVGALAIAGAVAAALLLSSDEPTTFEQSETASSVQASGSGADPGGSGGSADGQEKGNLLGSNPGLKVRSIDCSPGEVSDVEGEVLTIYRVTNGRLGERCFGERNDVLLRSWLALNELATPEQLAPIRLFAGINSDSASAFTVAVGTKPFDQFAIAVDLQSARLDGLELRLTMAHEFSHVFTQMPTQNTADRRGTCDTFYNGYLCFKPSSYVYAWTEQFWAEAALEALPLSGANDEDGGLERCSTNPSFLGSYAAVHPEEDLAESFSAFVFGLEVPPAVQGRVDFFLDYPELVAYRDNAQSSAYAGSSLPFDRCGP